MKEVKLGRILGPFLVQPLDPLIYSPVDMVEKNSTNIHRILHLSYPKEKLGNSFISPDNSQTHY